MSVLQKSLAAAGIAFVLAALALVAAMIVDFAATSDTDLDCVGADDPDVIKDCQRAAR